MLPIPAAKKSTPVATIALASSIGANSPLPTIPSSSPPIVPTSASTEIPLACAFSTTSFANLRFSSIGRCEPSNMIEV